MNTILYFSTNGRVYETRAYTKADIDRLFKGRQLHCLTSPDRQFDFWFSPSSPGCQSQINEHATEVLMATTNFTAKSVPLLPGCVVVATHDADGDLDGLSWQQLDLLTRKSRSLSNRELRLLDKRIARHNRRRTRPTRTAATAPVTAVKPRTPAHSRA